MLSSLILPFSGAVLASPAVAAASMWSTPTNLSTGPSGMYAPDQQVGFDGAGNAIAIWVLNNGVNNIVQTSSSSDAGATWSTPFDLSASGGNAYYPQVSFDDAGNAIAIWSRNDGVERIAQTSSSSDAGATWSTPFDLSASGGNANSPQVSVDGAGNAIAIWSRDDGVESIVQTRRSSDGGANWSTLPVDLSASGASAGLPQLSCDASGNAIAIWSAYDGVESIVQTSTSSDGGANWSTPFDLSASGGNAALPQVSVDGAGNAIAIWMSDDGVEKIVQTSSSRDGGAHWSTPPVDVSASGGRSQFPQVSFDSAGNAIAIWFGAIVQTSTSSDGGANWSTPPVDVSASGANFPQLSWDASGNAVAIWSTYDGVESIVQSSMSSDGGANWSTPFDLSASGMSAGFPQLSFDASGNAVAIWSAHDGDIFVVQTSSLAAPALADTGASESVKGFSVAISAGLLVAGAWALVMVRRRLAAN